jgi:hypothetical protein
MGAQLKILVYYLNYFISDVIGCCFSFPIHKEFPVEIEDFRKVE